MASSTQPTASSLHQLLRQAAKDTPRFLFRKWTSTSGGDARLNTLARITPHAFLNAEDSEQRLEDIDENKLRASWNGHYHGKNVNSPFSSWSASLQFVLRMASDSTGFSSMAEHPTGPADDAFISMVDTAMLSANNVAVWTAHPLLTACGDVDGRVNEFLIYGVVEGAAHSAVQAKEMWEQGLPRIFPKVSSRPSHRDQVDIVTRIAARFKPAFALPVACYLLARRSDGSFLTKDASWQDLYPELIPDLAKRLASYHHEAHDIGTEFNHLITHSPDVAEALSLLRAVAHGVDGSTANDREDDAAPEDGTS